ncbi:hypothetical protein A0H76_2933 [Hepatospora eriocheir]|uniref:Transmembrane protein n=1 Tax=Hepatospora eriocheir TaxID=1081669 RepID=A0A1X0Q5I0_9MICR|nr:hypothetical protein A0H76_2933 [Hepatospora eriocheir]
MEFKQQEKKKPFWICDRRFIFEVLILFAVTVFGLWFYFDNDYFDSDNSDNVNSDNVLEKSKVKKLIKYSKGFYIMFNNVERQLLRLKDEDFPHFIRSFITKFLENIRFLLSHLESCKNGIKKVPLKQLIIFYNLIDLTNENDENFDINKELEDLNIYRNDVFEIITDRLDKPLMYLKKLLFFKI